MKIYEILKNSSALPELFMLSCFLLPLNLHPTPQNRFTFFTTIFFSRADDIYRYTQQAEKMKFITSKRDHEYFKKKRSFSYVHNDDNKAISQAMRDEKIFITC